MDVARAMGLLPLAFTALLGMPVDAIANNTIVTLAGTGAASSAGDDRLATQAGVQWPYGMGWTGDGALLVAEVNGNRIRRIAPDGTITTVVGDGTASSTGNNVPATSATTRTPQGLAVDPDGETYYISERTASQIRKVDANGFISTVVGTLGSGFAGDGGPASAARVSAPEGLSVASNGDLYIADRGNNRIRMIAHDADGTVSSSSTITTVAGTGSGGFSGDGAAATLATFNQPLGVSAGASGSFVVSDFSNHRIRRVDSDGTVTTIAGNGSQCSPTTTLCGDGGLATAASLNNPAGIVGDGAGGYVFADYSSHRVRRVDSHGIIRTVIGTGTMCTATDACGDGGRAELAASTRPTGVLIGPGGLIYMSGEGNRVRVRIPDPTDAGPQGPPGGPGAHGSGGGQGVAGDAGAVGGDGAEGATGQAGATGAVGPPGADGDSGVVGEDGSRGTGGATGTAGPNGSDGAAGTNGANGASGNPGRVGAQGSFFPLAITMPAPRIVVRSARHTYLRIFVSRGAEVQARVTLRGRRIVTARRVFQRVGRKRFDFGRLPRGNYRVALRATLASSHLFGPSVATDAATLVIR